MIMNVLINQEMYVVEYYHAPPLSGGGIWLAQAVPSLRASAPETYRGRLLARLRNETSYIRRLYQTANNICRANFLYPPIFSFL